MVIREPNRHSRFGRTLSAVARGVAALVVATPLYGCATAGFVDPPVLQSVRVEPVDTTIAEGATVRFQAIGRWSDGRTGPAPNVTWSATGGAIDAGGSYVGSGGAGAFDVVASAAGPVQGVATVRVVGPVPTLLAITIAPDAVTLTPGATQQFSVTGTWSDGANSGVNPVFDVSGGTITGGGSYTAPAMPGSYRVTATVAAPPLADTATVTVPPPPQGLQNECATPGAGWIWCDDFDQNRLASYFEVDAAGGSFTRTNGAGNDGSWGMRARFAAGQVSTGSLKLAFGRTPGTYFRPVDAGTANYREIYWRVYLRNAPGWTGGGGDKLSRATVLATSGWAQAMIGHVWSAGAGSKFLALDPASGTDAQGNLKTTQYNDFANFRWLGIGRGPTPIFDAAHVGRWVCVETHIRLNTAGQSNGVFELWLDGTPEVRQTNLNWLGGYSAYGLNAVFLENYWNSGSPVAQERYFDNFVVSTQPIGC